MLPQIKSAGPPLDTAQAAAVLVHGRGADAASMLEFAGQLAPVGVEAARRVAFLAPQAPDFTWYPYSFLAPLEQNEPHLTNALQTLEDILRLLGEAGLPPERILLLGFSQGACLALEFAARNACRFGGIAGLSGGLIGPPGPPRRYPGNFAGAPVFLGCSDVDPHIPLARVQETAQVLELMGAQVEKRIYPGLGHIVNKDESIYVAGMIEALLL